MSDNILYEVDGKVCCISLMVSNIDSILNSRYLYLILRKDPVTVLEREGL
jgi:hypothetical protein